MVSAKLPKPGNHCLCPSSTKLNTTLTWINKYPGEYADLDLYGILFDELGDIVDVVFFKNLKSCGLTHTGDDREGNFSTSQPKVNEALEIDLQQIDSQVKKAKFIAIVVSAFTGNTFLQIEQANVEVKDDKQSYISTTLKSSENCTLLVCSLTRVQNGWDLINLNKEFDTDERLVDVLPTIAEMLSSKNKDKMDLSRFEVSKDAFVNKKISFSKVVLGIGWDSVYGVSRTKFYMYPYVLCYGKLGPMLQYVDENTHNTKDGGLKFIPEEYKVVEIDLEKIAPNVATIVVVMVACPGLNAFSQIKNPYGRLYVPSAGDIFKATPSMKEVTGKQAYVLCKLERDLKDKMKWDVTPICEGSEGSNPMWDLQLRSTVLKHVKIQPAPECIQFTTEKALRITIDEVGIDFFRIRNLAAIHYFEFDKFRFQHHKKHKINFEHDFKKKLSFRKEFNRISMSSYMLVSTKDLEKRNISYAYFALSFLGENKDTRPQFQVERLIKVYDYADRARIGYCIFDKLDTTSETNATVAVIIYKDQEGWKIRQCNFQIPIDEDNYQPGLYKLRKLSNIFKEGKKLSTGEQYAVNKPSNLMIAWGVESETGNEPHKVEGTVELYDQVGQRLGFALASVKCEQENIQFYSKKNLCHIGEGDDEQMIVKRVEDSPVKYMLVNVDAKSLKALKDTDIIYVRITDSESGEEYCRVTAPASLILQNITRKVEEKKTEDQQEIKDDSTEEDYDPEDDDDENEISMISITQCLEGWVFKGIGKMIENPFPDFLPLPPSSIIVEIIRARNLAAMDINGYSDPYCNITLKEKNGNKRKVQKYKTQIHRKTLNPVWNEKFEFQVYDPEDEFVIHCRDWDQFKKSDKLGKVRVKVYDALRNGTEGVAKFYKLQQELQVRRVSGEIMLKFVGKRENPQQK